MDRVSQDVIIGIDVFRDWLDIHCLSAGCHQRFPNSDGGDQRVTELARSLGAVVCFEATGGQEWRLWAALDAAGIEARQLPPAQIKAFAASRGTRAKTDRIDAELIARFLAFRPDAGRALPAQKLRLLRALTNKRGQLVETRKRLLSQFKARQKQGLDEPFEEMDAALHLLLNEQITTLEHQIEHFIAADETLAGTSRILRSVPGIGPVASTMLPLAHVNMHCRAVDRGNARTWPDIWRTGGGTYRSCSNCTRQWRITWKARHRRWAAPCTACHVPGRFGCEPSQSYLETLRGQIARSWEATQSRNHSCRQKARHPRQCTLQITTEMGCSNDLKDTVARLCVWRRMSS